MMIYLEAFIFHPISFFIPLLCIIVFWGIPGLVVFLILRKTKLSARLKVFIMILFIAALTPFARFYFYDGEYRGEFINEYAMKKLSRMPAEKRRGSAAYRYVLNKFIDCDYEARIGSAQLGSLVDDRLIIKDMLHEYKNTHDLDRKTTILSLFVYTFDINEAKRRVSSLNTCYTGEKNIAGEEKVVLPIVEDFIRSGKPLENRISIMPELILDGAVEEYERNHPKKEKTTIRGE